jgi:tetratricopeptide (TPR) repeat protein
MSSARRAVLLDPELAEGWASWGVLAFEMDRDWITAELALKRAIGLKPSYARARAWLGDLLRQQGRVKEAIEQQRVALEIDPLSPVLNTTLALSLAVSGRYDEAREQYDTPVVAGDRALAYSGLLLWGLPMGLTADEVGEQAVGLAEVMGASDPEIARVLGSALTDPNADGAIIVAAREVLETLIAEQVFTTRQIASMYTTLGDYEAALNVLEASVDAGDLSLGLVGIEPTLDPLRDDPRMQALMDELGLPNGYDPAADTYVPEG